MGKLSEEERQLRAKARARRDAIAAEEDDRRCEERRRQWKRDGTYLSYEEMVSGVACRGCGQAVTDNTGSWPPLMKMTDAERAEYDEAERRYRELHPDCRAVRWSMSGSRTTHCGYCCPPPPLGPSQIQQLGRLLVGRSVDERELDEWRLTLTCDHVVVRRRHRTSQAWTTQVVDCPECGMRRGVVESQRLGPAVPAAAERQRLAAELATAEATVARHERAAAKAQQQVAELTVHLAQADSPRKSTDSGQA